LNPHVECERIISEGEFPAHNVVLRHLRPALYPKTRKPLSRAATRKFPVPQPTSRGHRIAGLWSDRNTCGRFEGKFTSRPAVASGLPLEVGRTEGSKTASCIASMRKGRNPLFSSAGTRHGALQIGQDTMPALQTGGSLRPADETSSCIHAKILIIISIERNFPRFYEYVVLSWDQLDLPSPAGANRRLQPRHWYPPICNRAVAVPHSKTGELRPFRLLAMQLSVLESSRPAHFPSG